MRYKSSQKQETRQRIIAAAERSFKKVGYSGIGVDGLAKDAGVTSGAFYGHFGSKEDAFKEAIISGMSSLNKAIEELQEQHGENWWQAFAKLYTSHKRSCDLADSCAMQSLTPEVGRASDEIRALYEHELLQIARRANKKQDMDNTWASLAMLIGGVTLARAVKQPKLANEISNAVKKHVMAAHITK